MTRCSCGRGDAPELSAMRELSPDTRREGCCASLFNRLIEVNSFGIFPRSASRKV